MNIFRPIFESKQKKLDHIRVRASTKSPLEGQRPRSHDRNTYDYVRTRVLQMIDKNSQGKLKGRTEWEVAVAYVEPIYKKVFAHFSLQNFHSLILKY